MLKINIFYILNDKNALLRLVLNTRRVKIFYLIKQEMQKLNKIKYYNFEIKLNYNGIKYKKPKNSKQGCILKNKTYTIPSFIPINIKYKNLLVFKIDFKKCYIISII